MSELATFKELLKTYSHEGTLYETHSDGSLTCFACGHRCRIRQGRDGICKVRFNQGGKLFVPANYTVGLQCDPVEKKPFYHVFPGEFAVTFGMPGCDFHCSYCQNWLTSQALRDPSAYAQPQPISPCDLVELGKKQQARLIVSSYNEPLITSEWARDVFEHAKKAGFLTGYVSNGNATPEVLDYLRPVTDLFNIDLKSFRDKNYRKLGGVLTNILKAIEMVHEKGFWLEVVTLIIPGFNDSDTELRQMAGFLSEVSPDIPWHVTAFHQSYQMRDHSDTSAETLIRAAEIGYEAGLHYVYAGNMAGQVGEFENTFCPGCGSVVIRRTGYLIQENRLSNGSCPDCAEKIAGIWL